MAGCQTATDLMAPGVDAGRACRSSEHARGFHISSALFINRVMPTMTGDANRAVPEGGVPDGDEFVGPGGAGAQPAAAADVPEVATAAALDERCGASQARASPFCRPEDMPSSTYLFNCGVCRCTNTGWCRTCRRLSRGGGPLRPLPLVAPASAVDRRCDASRYYPLSCPASVPGGSASLKPAASASRRACARWRCWTPRRRASQRSSSWCARPPGAGRASRCASPGSMQPARCAQGLHSPTPM